MVGWKTGHDRLCRGTELQLPMIMKFENLNLHNLLQISSFSKTFGKICPHEISPFIARYFEIQAFKNVRSQYIFEFCNFRNIFAFYLKLLQNAYIFQKLLLDTKNFQIKWIPNSKNRKKIWIFFIKTRKIGYFDKVSGNLVKVLVNAYFDGLH